MHTTTVLLILGGLVLLVAGGEVLVRGAGGLATTLGMPPLLVGLTVVAFATSAPELAVSLQSALDGNAGLAVGNVVGSNIANVLLILGVSALAAPLAVLPAVVRRDVPVMIGIAVLTLALSLDQELSLTDGGLLLAVAVGYLILTVIQSRRQQSPTTGEVAVGEAAGDQSRHRPLWLDGVLVVVGVALLVFGADWLVEGATTVASAFGVSDLVIGLTVVAIGTSLPELATSVIATVRGERDLAVGNIVGSCLFNLGLVLGLTAVLSGGDMPVAAAAVNFDLPVMVASALALLPIAFTGLRIARWEGALFLGYYLAYLTFLVLTAVEHTRLGVFNLAMLGFVVPITVVTLAVLSVGEWRLHRRLAADPAPEPPVAGRGG